MRGWLTPRPGRFIPGKDTRYPPCRRLGGSQGRSGQVRKFLPAPEFVPWTVASRHSDWVIPAPYTTTGKAYRKFRPRYQRCGAFQFNRWVPEEPDSSSTLTMEIADSRLLGVTSDLISGIQTLSNQLMNNWRMYFRNQTGQRMVYNTVLTRTSEHTHLRYRNYYVYVIPKILFPFGCRLIFCVIVILPMRYAACPADLIASQII